MNQTTDRQQYIFLHTYIHVDGNRHMHIDVEIQGDRDRQTEQHTTIHRETAPRDKGTQRHTETERQIDAHALWFET